MLSFSCLARVAGYIIKSRNHTFPSWASSMKIQPFVTPQKKMIKCENVYNSLCFKSFFFLEIGYLIKYWSLQCVYRYQRLPQKSSICWVNIYHWDSVAPDEHRDCQLMTASKANQSEGDPGCLVIRALSCPLLWFDVMSANGRNQKSVGCPSKTVYSPSLRFSSLSNGFAIK